MITIYEIYGTQVHAFDTISIVTWIHAYLSISYKICIWSATPVKMPLQKIMSNFFLYKTLKKWYKFS